MPVGSAHIYMQVLGRISGGESYGIYDVGYVIRYYYNAIQGWIPTMAEVSSATEIIDALGKITAGSIGVGSGTYEVEAAVYGLE